MYNVVLCGIRLEDVIPFRVLRLRLENTYVFVFLVFLPKKAQIAQLTD